jgi:hypothetical protein
VVDLCQCLGYNNNLKLNNCFARDGRRRRTSGGLISCPGEGHSKNNLVYTRYFKRRESLLPGSRGKDFFILKRR